MDREELQFNQMKKLNSGAINSSSVRLMEIADRIRDRELGGRQFSRLKVDQTGNIDFKQSRRKVKESWTKEDYDFIEEEPNLKNNLYINEEFFCFTGNNASICEQFQNMVHGKMKNDKKKPSKKILSKKKIKKVVKKQKKVIPLKKRETNNDLNKNAEVKKLKKVAKQVDMISDISSRHDVKKINV
jgi:hypothetical protein